jgi:hypothetical protein
LKHAKEISNLLKNSSGYWKGTFSNLGKNFCGCARGEEMLEKEDLQIENNNTYNNIGKGNLLIY